MGGLPSKISNFAHQAIAFIDRIPRQEKIYIGIILVGAILVPVIFHVVGFTAGGVALGSLAAAWHGSIGNVAAGSIFAILQSLGTTPARLAVIGALTGGFGCVIHSLWESLWDEDRGSEGAWKSE